MVQIWDEWNKKRIKNEWVHKFREAQPGEEWKKVLAAYERSDIWIEIRNASLKKASYQCQNPKHKGQISRNLQVHHKNYDHVGGYEKENDLLVLCPACHRIYDKRREIESETKREDALYKYRFEKWAKRKYGIDRELIDPDRLEDEYQEYLDEEEDKYWDNWTAI